jgi:hypothetical protein
MTAKLKYFKGSDARYTHLNGANVHTIIFFSIPNGALSCDIYLIVLTFFIFSNSLSNVTSPGFFILMPYVSAISGFTGDRFENSYLKV